MRSRRILAGVGLGVGGFWVFGVGVGVGRPENSGVGVGVGRPENSGVGVGQKSSDSATLVVAFAFQANTPSAGTFEGHSVLLQLLQEVNFCHQNFNS